MYLRSNFAVFDRLSSNLVEPFLSENPWTTSLAKRIQEYYMAFQNAMCISCTSNTEIILTCQDADVGQSAHRFLFYRCAMEELNHNVL